MTAQRTVNLADYTITDGPSRDAMFEYLKTGKSPAGGITFTFMLRKTDPNVRMRYEHFTLQAHIGAIAAESGGHHSWNVTAHFSDDPRRNLYLGLEGAAVELFYHTGHERTRRHGAVVDARPNSKRATLLRNGDVFVGGYRYAHVSGLPQ